MSMDRIDFCIYKPTPFLKIWYSHKFKGVTLWYEVGLCIETGNIVWINGLYLPGVFNDIGFFRDAMKGSLHDGE